MYMISLPHNRFIYTLWTCAAHTAAVARAPPPPTQCVGGVYYVGAVPDNLSAPLYQPRYHHAWQCHQLYIEDITVSSLNCV